MSVDCGYRTDVRGQGVAGPALQSGDAQIWHLTGKVAADQPARRIPISHFPFRIGRRADSTLSLECATISGNHAEIRHNGLCLVLRDLGSTNGTYLNGLRVEGDRLLQSGDLLQFADLAFRLGVETGDCRRTISRDVLADVQSLANFDQLLDGVSLQPHFQPILRFGADGERDDIVGFEALARSSVPGLESPFLMFRAAEQLEMQGELSRVLRQRALETGQEIVGLCECFLNTHPSEVAEYGLLQSLDELRARFPSQRITLEIHELAVTSRTSIREIRNQLDQLDMGLAFDDFGAGRGRLQELIEVRPHYLKFDRTMIKDIDVADPDHQEVLASLVRITQELGVTPLAEGVETAAEDKVCRQLGFEMAQGYYYGRPAAPADWMAKTAAQQAAKHQALLKPHGQDASS